MNPSEIEILVNKYLEGDTSREEEATLRSMAVKGQLPNKFGFLRDIFLFTQAEKNLSISKEIDLSVANVIKLNPVQKKSNWLRISISLSGIAAAFLVAAIFLLENDTPDPTESYSEFVGKTEDPNEIILGALLYTSDRMNKADESIRKISLYHKSYQKANFLEDFFAN